MEEKEKKTGFWAGCKRYLAHIFVDGMAGMALGLFATLIVGTIISQLGALFGGRVGGWIVLVASIAKALTGAGIGVGVALKYKAAPLVTLSAATAGMVGAFASQIIAGSVVTGGLLTLKGPGEPLGAFLAAFAAVEVGRLVAGKTKVDILVTPLVTITAGSVAGLLAGPPISAFMTSVGALVNWGTEQLPFWMGIVVSVLMGLALTLPISSAAIGVVLDLSGLAAGAAVAGCCAQMVGFAAASFRENRWGGLLAQGLGTSMLQMPNIIRRPAIWLPATLASVVTGPISTCLFRMTCNATGSGMGTAGLIGPIMSFQTMTAAGVPAGTALWQIALVLILLPAALALLFSELLRRIGWIREGDMRLGGL